MSTHKAPFNSNDSPPALPSPMPPEEDQRPATASPPESSTIRVVDSIAFALSAVLSPYIVIPVGTIGLIWSRASPDPRFWLWLGLSLLFSTLLPALYVVWGIKKGLITDVHVMEREQRNAPFAIAIVGGLVAVFLLRMLGAPPSVWGLSLVLAVNGFVIYVITLYTKISVHVSVLSATVLGAAMLDPKIPPFLLLCLVPPLIWARWKRGRHSVWQGLAGFCVASLITVFTLLSIGLGSRVTEFVTRVLT